MTARVVASRAGRGVDRGLVGDGATLRRHLGLRAGCAGRASLGRCDSCAHQHALATAALPNQLSSRAAAPVADAHEAGCEYSIATRSASRGCHHNKLIGPGPDWITARGGRRTRANGRARPQGTQPARPIQNTTLRVPASLRNRSPPFAGGASPKHDARTSRDGELMPRTRRRPAATCAGRTRRRAGIRSACAFPSRSDKTVAAFKRTTRFPCARVDQSASIALCSAVFGGSTRADVFDAHAAGARAAPRHQLVVRTLGHSPAESEDGDEIGSPERAPEIAVPFDRRSASIMV